MIKLECGQYYIDSIFHVVIVFEQELEGYYWFYYSEEDRHIAYYEYELENLRRY